MTSEEMRDQIVQKLEALKAVDVCVLDVRKITSITDIMVIASGTSTRHVKSLADRVTGHMRSDGVRPLGIEGEETAEWVLVDFADVVVHVMLPKTRAFYQLERLWSMDPAPEHPQREPGPDGLKDAI